MHFEEPEFDPNGMIWETSNNNVPLPIGNSSNTGNLKTDMLLLALLVKAMEVASASGDDSYKGLKTELAKLINTLKSAMRTNLPHTTAEKTGMSKPPMSDEDKKFVMDEIFKIMKGKDSFFGFAGDSFLKDYLSKEFLNPKYDDEDDDK